MPGFTRLLRSLAGLCILIATTSSAAAGDAAARKVLGFSPDTAFAFEQYTTPYGAIGHIVEIQVIDTRRGTYGSVIVSGLTLTLSLDEATPLVLQQDQRLPRSRRCVTEYGIAEAWLHEASDGTQMLAVLIETVDAHELHAGPNRRFMAVTKRLPG